ncbi:pyruvate ferredoxin oxidoreductase [bacterium]|nr:MAG: pyruvate ferredoxin oxidoreductase [bacterium]RKZ21226.1 MAG: pyruvate ferredoxin oxidoreductase [bacterium]
MKVVAKTANEAMAEAMRQINPDVVAAYPITPATEIVQIFSSFVHDGLVDTEFIAVESEHSAMSACIGAAAAGARVMTSTSSQGLALMDEVLYIAAALRLPIVICEINRALSAPINIHCDHSDTMNVRDSGWIQIYAEDSQEAYDSVIQAMKIAEEAFLPAMVTADGFILSHAMQRIDMLEDEEVQAFIGEHKSPYNLLDIYNPITIGPLDLQDYFFEHKRQEADAMMKAPEVIKKVADEFGQKFGRKYGLVEEYRLDDAEYAIVVIGSTAGTAKDTVDMMRDKGHKVGLLRIRVFRPFPAEEIVKALKNVRVVGVMDRADGVNAYGGPVFMEVRAALYEEEKKPDVYSFVYGLGGRDVKPVDIERVFQMIMDADKGKKIDRLNYIGVRE